MSEYKEMITRSLNEQLERTQEVLRDTQKLILEQAEEIERLRKRNVPDMTELSKNDHKQLKDLWIIYGSGYLISVIRHLDHLAGIPDVFSNERDIPSMERE